MTNGGNKNNNYVRPIKDHVRIAEDLKDIAEDERQQNEVKKIASFLLAAIKN